MKEYKSKKFAEFSDEPDIDGFDRRMVKVMLNTGSISSVLEGNLDVSRAFIIVNGSNEDRIVISRNKIRNITSVKDYSKPVFLIDLAGDIKVSIIVQGR